MNHERPNFEKPRVYAKEGMPFSFLCDKCSQVSFWGPGCTSKMRGPHYKSMVCKPCSEVVK